MTRVHCGQVRGGSLWPGFTVARLEGGYCDQGSLWPG